MASSRAKVLSQDLTETSRDQFFLSTPTVEDWGMIISEFPNPDAQCSVFLNQLKGFFPNGLPNTPNILGT